jgi:hypothetical protein
LPSSPLTRAADRLAAAGLRGEDLRCEAVADALAAKVKQVLLERERSEAQVAALLEELRRRWPLQFVAP